MMPVLNVALLLLTFITAIAAIGGETWKSDDGPWRDRITRRGWASLACLAATLVLGTSKEVVNQTALSEARADRVRSETKLQDKTEDIAELNRQIAATVTGGDTFPYLLPGRPSSQTQKADLTLLSEGEYPLYDLSVRIQDVDQLISSVRNSIESKNMPTDSILESIQLMQSGSLERTVGNLSPNIMLPFGTFDLSGRAEAHLRVSMFARNGTVQQEIKFRRLTDGWAISYRVARANETLLESIHERLPLD